MRAVVLRDGRLRVADVPEPEPGPGQLLVEPIAVGVCGSDLSAVAHTAEFLQASRDARMDTYLFDADRDLVLGHEFTARVVGAGPDANGYAVGDVLVVLPYVIDRNGVGRTVGYASDYPGALAERVVVQAFGHVRVPPGLDPALAAVTEPLTTGTAAVGRTGIGPDHGAVVIGCGPVGLGAITALSERGVTPLVASDPSAARRAKAEAFGASVVVDPAEHDPVEVWRSTAPSGRRLVVFEASGARGMLNRLLYAIPPFTRIVVVGTQMTDDVIRPVVGIYKNATVEFCGGPGEGQDYPAELAATLARIADGRIDAASIVTGRTGLDGVPEVFRLLRPQHAGAVEHMKILVEPQRASSAIESVDPIS